jgi:hypothetical protein
MTDDAPALRPSATQAGASTQAPAVAFTKRGVSLTDQKDRQ